MVRRPDRGIPQITGEGMETSFPARRLLSALQRKTGMGRTALFLCAVIARWIFRRAFFVGKMPGPSRIAADAAKGMGSYERTNDLAVRTDRPFRRRLYGGTARGLRAGRKTGGRQLYLMSCVMLFMRKPPLCVVCFGR